MSDVTFKDKLISDVSNLIQSVKPYFQSANDILAGPTQLVLSKLSLRTEYLPDTLKIPLNFTMTCLFIVFYIMVYTNDIIYNLIGAVYPIVHTLYLFEENPHTDKLLTMNKYWILFTLIMLIETVGEFILYFVPFYSYGKIIFVYALIRNDFLLTNSAFESLKIVYAGIDQKLQISSYIEKIKSS